jgi:hypothetical protein
VIQTRLVENGSFCVANAGKILCAERVDGVLKLTCFVLATLALCDIITSMRYLYIEHTENRWSLVNQDGRVVYGSSSREDVLHAYRCVQQSQALKRKHFSVSV